MREAGSPTRRREPGALAVTARGDGEPKWASRQRCRMRVVALGEDVGPAPANNWGRTARGVSGLRGEGSTARLSAGEVPAREAEW